MPEPIRRVLDALLEDLQAGLPIRLDAAERYRAEVDGYRIQFERIVRHRATAALWCV